MRKDNGCLDFDEIRRIAQATRPKIIVIAAWIAQVLEFPRDANRLVGIRDNVKELCRKFPVYPPSWSKVALRSSGRG